MDPKKAKGAKGANGGGTEGDPTHGAPKAPDTPQTGGPTDEQDQPTAGAPGIPTDEDFLETLPADLRHQPGALLLAEACELYGINPDAEAGELAGWRYYPGNPRAGEAERVVIVTHGGRKLAHPMDEATERVLRDVFGLVVSDREGNVLLLPLPDDTALPAEARDGIVRSRSHVGNNPLNLKAEANRRAQAARARSAKA
ncbi:MAG: hypothetical protein AB7P99_06360 [Vicinamibacterales bacterium]